ncbi:MAG: hypothetical protein R3C62_00770 [Chloroflexota bacterium]
MTDDRRRDEWGETAVFPQHFYGTRTNTDKNGRFSPLLLCSPAKNGRFISPHRYGQLWIKRPFFPPAPLLPC